MDRHLPGQALLPVWDACSCAAMIKSLEQAIEKIREMPADAQAYAASVLEQIASSGGGVYRLADDERALVREGVADLDAGRVVSDSDMAAFWSRHGG